MIWEASATYEERGEICYKILVGKSKAKRPLGECNTDERIILKWI
jgi:hypothetical protein